MPNVANWHLDWLIPVPVCHLPMDLYTIIIKPIENSKGENKTEQNTSSGGSEATCVCFIIILINQHCYFLPHDSCSKSVLCLLLWI